MVWIFLKDYLVLNNLYWAGFSKKVLYLDYGVKGLYRSVPSQSRPWEVSAFTSLKDLQGGMNGLTKLTIYDIKLIYLTAPYIFTKMKDLK